MQRFPSLSVPLIGYAVALAIVLSVALMAILNLDAAAADRLAAIRMHELHLTQAERLRWRSELKVAAARGYVITGDPMFRDQLRAVDDAVHVLQRDLEHAEDDPHAVALLAAVKRLTAAYDGAQHALFALKTPSADSVEIARRFEQDLLPLRKRLHEAIDDYVSRQGTLLGRTYAQLEKERARTLGLAVGAVALAAVMAAGLFWSMSRALARMYRRERSALAHAEAALGARDEMLGVVAHDLRNPLSAITMKATLLQKGSDLTKMRQHAESIEAIAGRMEHLIRSLLDIASIEAGRLSVRPARCEVRSVLRDTVNLFDVAAANRSIALQQEAPDSELAFEGDRERVLQVLSNLVGNAIKFTHQDGTVRLAVDTAEGFVRFSVSDSGPGIAPENLPRLFDRYWKKDDARTKGTGLGLFIAKGIVEAHRGRIWAESQPGAGATFRFTLPLASAGVSDALAS